MLMTVGGLFLAVILLIAAAITKRGWLAKFVACAVVVWFAFYAVMLLGFSLTSTEKVLAVGEAKEYCGFYLDCHMHTMVTSIRTSKTIGDQKANGTFYIVKVKVFSDAKNPAIAHRLLEPKARVVLPDASKLERDMEAEAKLPTAGVRLDADIHNKETIEKEIVFDMPDNATNAKLLVTEGYGIDKTIERALVGDEDSLFHAQTFFKLEEQTPTAGL